jgi:GNAT superfamily N-acetyltransferase
MTENVVVERIETDAQILATAEVMRQLRPHIAAENYLTTVRRMIATERFRLVAVREGGVVRAVAGYRIMEMLFCGRILYVDDLITDERTRSKGHGKRLLEWLQEEGRAQECGELHLDSGVHREGAHRFYFREGLTISDFHFRTKL